MEWHAVGIAAGSGGVAKSRELKGDFWFLIPRD